RGPAPFPPLFPYPTLFRSREDRPVLLQLVPEPLRHVRHPLEPLGSALEDPSVDLPGVVGPMAPLRHPGPEFLGARLEQRAPRPGIGRAQVCTRVTIRGRLR